MTEVPKKTILRIRTFADDVARARGEKVVHAPKISKRKVSAQELTDTLLKDTIETHSAEDFIGTTDGDYIPMEPSIKKIDTQQKSAKENQRNTHTEKEKGGIKLKSLQKKKKSFVSKKSLDSLSEDINKITLPTQPSNATAIAFDTTNNSVQDGTLVTNKKKNRFHVLPAVGTSMKSWFSNTTEQLTKEKEPSQTIANAKSRITVIKEAARASSHTPIDDHGTVIKKLKKKRRKKKNTTSLTIKKKEDVKTPQWESSKESPLIKEEASPQQIAPHIKNVPEVQPLQINLKSQEKEIKINQTQKAPIHETQESKNTPVIEAVAQTKPPPVPTALEENKTHSIPQKKERKKPSSPKKVSHKKRKYQTTLSKTSGIPIYIYLVVIFMASLLGIGITVYWFTSSTSQEDVVILRIPTLFTADKQIAVEMPKNRDELLSTLLDQTITTRETLQIYPAHTNESGIRVPVAPQDILSVLAWRAPGSFTRAITDITFGSYNGTNPFMIFKATNFDIAFGGLLDWEQDMSTDLSPLFGTPITQSFDPYARTNTQIRSAFFRDEIISNKSARVLVDTQDIERLVYVFVTPQIVLVAPNTQTITAIIPLVTQ